MQKAQHSLQYTIIITIRIITTIAIRMVLMPMAHHHHLMTMTIGASTFCVQEGISSLYTNTNKIETTPFPHPPLHTLLSLTKNNHSTSRSHYICCATRRLHHYDTIGHLNISSSNNKNHAPIQRINQFSNQSPSAISSTMPISIHRRLSNPFRRKKPPPPPSPPPPSPPPEPEPLPPTQPPLLQQQQQHQKGGNIQERLFKEVLRKLQLATDAEEKEDRDIVCSELFADITGELNAAARESTGAIYQRWYEVLAPYFCRNTPASEHVLRLCRHLWGQPYTAPIFALLLHQWMFVHPDAGGEDQRLKHLNILISGARQLFLGDAETGNTAFASLYSFIAEQTVLAPPPRTRLDAMPPPAREGVMGVAAAFAPYYLPAPDLVRALAEFPPPELPPLTTGADFLIDRIVDILAKEIRAEDAVVRYLKALTALQDSGPLKTIRTSTRVRLQGEVYSLTQQGGPRYVSREVNRVAFTALDALFPHGRRTRRVINVAFRFLHPQEWPWVWWDTYGAVLRAGYSWVVAAVRTLAGALSTHRKERRRVMRAVGGGGARSAVCASDDAVADTASSSSLELRPR